MSRDFVQEIKALAKPNVHIKNAEKVNKIITALIVDGFKKLQVISDFDLTLTKQHEEGKKHYSSFTMFQKCPSVSENYIKEVEVLSAKYFPMEYDPKIPVDVKTKLMEEWWYQSAKALNGEKVSAQELHECVGKLQTPLRDGTKDLFKALNIQRVPVLVFSAGLGDSVVAVLKYNNILLENVKVISNFLKYDETGTILGFQGPLIHVLNKNEYAIKDSEYHVLVKNRGNVILLGDALGDAKMADGIDHAENILKIGFLYENIETNLEHYKNTFDIVLIDDQTMDVINAIIELIQ